MLDLSGGDGARHLVTSLQSHDLHIGLAGEYVRSGHRFVVIGLGDDDR